MKPLKVWEVLLILAALYGNSFWLGQVSMRETLVAAAGLVFAGSAVGTFKEWQKKRSEMNLRAIHDALNGVDTRPDSSIPAFDATMTKYHGGNAE